jgi:flagellar motor switch protein FliN
MTFSASPLVPGQESMGLDTWRKTAQQVLTAVNDALPQIPTPTPLEVDGPRQLGDDVVLPDPAGAAILGTLGQGAEGKVLLVLGQELIEALQGTPFGSLEPAQALKPVLETVATGVGARLEDAPGAVDVATCLSCLDGGVCVVIPLTVEGAVRAVVGVCLMDPGTRQQSSDSAADASSAARSWGIDMLRDVEMEVTCELGRTRMTVRRLLALAPGDVVELDRLAGSPADLLVNGTLLARGEVVVVDESFGLRITEIVTREAL